MITPRETRLIRVPDLRAFQRTIIEAAPLDDVEAARRCAVVVPTRAAARQLRYTFEQDLLVSGSATGMWLPDLVTRQDWYLRMHERVVTLPPVASEFEREVIALAAARAARTAGVSAPFTLRPRLVVEMLAFYDDLRRLEQSLDDFQRLVLGDLEPSLETDRGARRLAEQTLFLAEALRKYEDRLSSAGLIDEHGLRARLLAADSDRLYQRVIVTVGDHAIEPEGFWPADFDLLARLPGLEHVTIVATDALLGSGFYERLHRMLPGMEEERATARREVPVIAAPAGKDVVHSYRDREDELTGIVKTIKVGTRTAENPKAEDRLVDEDVAAVFARPLPYVYLATRVFKSSGVPFQMLDALPLAAEPWAGAVDVVCSFVLSDYTRASIVELLRSPHLSAETEEPAPDPLSISALDSQLQEQRYLGGRRRLVELARDWAQATDRRITLAAPAAAAAAALARELQSLEQEAPASVLLATLIAFLRRRSTEAPEPYASRNRRARAAILGVLENLLAAHLRHDDAVCTFAALAVTIKRWIESRTFAPLQGKAGVQLVDASAAAYGSFRDLYLLGLVETDWPERPRRSVFYPASLLASFGWTTEADRLRGARARFLDLLRLPARRVSLSTFVLEDEATVAPSILLEDVPDAGLILERAWVHERLRTTMDEALLDPVATSVLEEGAAAWFALRQGRRSADERVFHAFLGPQSPTRYGVRAVERYLTCPFQYFAGSVLGLVEERDDETTLSPQTRGQFVHAVFAEFFAEWHRVGHGAITPENLSSAQAIFASLAERLLSKLPEAERDVERALLFGSAAATGLAERVLRLEAEEPTDVLERLVEYPLEGEFTLEGPSGPRCVTVRGVADRLDLLSHGRFRVVDYKLTRAGRSSQTVQLPVYARCAEQQLSREREGEWRVAEAAYIALGQGRSYVALGAKGGLAQAMRDGQHRFMTAIDGIERGDFPPKPVDLHVCSSCPYPTVCRKDYVGDE